MKAKLTSINRKNGKVIRHRGIFDPEIWAPRKIDFLRNSYKFDKIDFEHPTTDTYTLDGYRSAGIPGTNGKEMEVHFLLTIID